MSLSDDLVASLDVALGFASGLDGQLGDDWLLTVGQARTSSADILGEEPTRAAKVQLTIGDDQEGTIALVALRSFAESLERAASDELLLTTVGPPLSAAASAIGARGGVEIEAAAAREVDQAGLDESVSGRESIVYPILDGTDPVAYLAIFLGAAQPGTSAAHPASQPSADTTHASSDPGNAYVLADVEMGVTAELGRTRMTVRELLSITPGAVLDLDRTAGAPVDVLVNGTLIARGEVVVIDEEFGIRISEILPRAATTH